MRYLSLFCVGYIIMAHALSFNTGNVGFIFLGFCYGIVFTVGLTIVINKD